MTKGFSKNLREIMTKLEPDINPRQYRLSSKMLEPIRDYDDILIATKIAILLINALIVYFLMGI